MKKKFYFLVCLYLKFSLIKKMFYFKNKTKKKKEKEKNEIKFEKSNFYGDKFSKIKSLLNELSGKEKIYFVYDLYDDEKIFRFSERRKV